jgi:hypothetical protein
MLAVASIGKLKMVIDFALPVVATSNIRLRRELVRRNTRDDQQRVISKTGCRMWQAPPRRPASRINFR